ncbi:hypothetical protein [Stratiformator vulcanicus]|uniref:Uncharacterized protein n=1 Tax=Stratiformator vulcanicus TaxID=2527980 RepID=A0A517QXM4_9PLAN|nr:hypothetical protein [Stratiformator vulcanicus]QDT36343.1 hypothetical protein Pan189_06990 [Stratiformator vulcanicus]
MASIQVEGDLLDRMNRETEPIELRDETGRVIGMFIPGSAGVTQIGTSEVPEETWREVDRRKSSGSSTTPAEVVLERLRTGYYEQETGR